MTTPQDEPMPVAFGEAVELAIKKYMDEVRFSFQDAAQVAWDSWWASQKPDFSEENVTEVTLALCNGCLGRNVAFYDRLARYVITHGFRLPQPAPPQTDNKQENKT